MENRTGVEAAQVENLAKMIHEAKAASLWWTMGVNQSHQGVRTAQAIINIALMTGNIGRPGTGPNSITGQANAMGSRLFSNTTSLFAGYDFLKAEDRQTMARLLDIDPSCIPDKNSLPYHKILEGIRDGQIKGLWVVATNPAHSWIDSNSLDEVFGKLDFLVVQDLFTTTDTARFADLILPAAGSGEKTGVFINSERRLGIVDKIIEAPEDVRSDFEILKLIAKAWGCDEMFSKWTDPEAVFGILRDISAGRPCDFTGVSGYQMLRESGGIQWPFPKGSTPLDIERRLFSDGSFYTKDGKAQFLFTEPTDTPELVNDEYPIALLTGRGTVVQFHTQTRTGKVEMLNKLSPDKCYVELNPLDASKLGLASGDTVKVSSRRGTVEVSCVISESLVQGQAFMPMHYEETNKLTFPAFDPYSSQPAYKHAAIKITALEST
ncbi:hypothetical protein MASR2M78_10740 [Treponema sp.]